MPFNWENRKYYKNLLKKHPIFLDKTEQSCYNSRNECYYDFRSLENSFFYCHSSIGLYISEVDTFTKLCS